MNVAMTKKEKAAMDEAIQRAELLAALRWTAPVEKDVPPPSTSIGGMKYTEGWVMNAHSKTVDVGWSTCISHGSGPAPKDGKRHFSASQNPRAMYSTKAKALAAMRHEIEKQAAQDLLKVDRLIKADA